MKEFIKKCPFVFALIISGFLVLDFYIVENDYLKIMPDVSDQPVMSEQEDLWDEEKQNTDLPGKKVQRELSEMKQDPLLRPDSDKDIQDNAQVQEELQNTEEEPQDAEEEQDTEEKQDTEEAYVGITEFISYEPSDVKSPYYRDPGRKALTTTYPYVTVDASYFQDAAFIGDSRTIGLFDYAGFEGADFYADNGFCAYLWKKKGQVTLQNTHQKVVLEEALSQKKYGKIYLMVGMNDCGYGTTETFQEILEEMLEMIEEKQPGAIIFLPAIMNVTKEKEEQQDLFTKIHINAKNVAIAECANGMNRFYLDYNDLYEDEEGYLRATDSFDGVHLYGNKYGPWIQFFLEHGIVKGEAADGDSDQ